MGAADEFVEENFIRATRHSSRARVLASRLEPILQSRYPRLFPTSPKVNALPYQGWTNFTMSAQSEGSREGYIVRLRARTTAAERASRSLPQFEKERYVIDRLVGIAPVPRIPEEGTGAFSIDISGGEASEFGYMLESYIPFEPAGRDLGREDRARCLYQLGESLRTIHSITVSGFGTEFDEARGAFSLSRWSDVVERRISEIEMSPIDVNLKRLIVARLCRLEALDPLPTIYHQDLLSNWGNVLVDDTRFVRGIIDWEFCGSGLAFHNEIASFIYALTRDGHEPEKIARDLTSILDGYGMSHREYQQHYEYDVETLVLLHAVSALQKFATLRKDGGLEREPWRQAFAERARKLCEHGAARLARA